MFPFATGEAGPRSGPAPLCARIIQAALLAALEQPGARCPSAHRDESMTNQALRDGLQCFFGLHSTTTESDPG